MRFVDVTQSRYRQNVWSRFCSGNLRRLEEVGEQGMMDAKRLHTIRDSCYHKEQGVENRMTSSLGARGKG